MAYLNLAAVRQCTQSEGPGKRFALWVQGCRQHCPGCCNPQMQEIKEAYVVDVIDIIDMIEKAKSCFDIEGVSFIGGEPLLQAEGLSQLAEWCRKRGLTVLVFTGFLYDVLLESDEIAVKKLLKNTDILVDGPYDETKPDCKRDWVGSENQRVIFLSDRYKNGIEYEKQEHSIELLISDKNIMVNGWPIQFK